ncbi:MAG: glutamyl-tRNA reductase [Microbacteriaceae bacterium]
MTASHKTASFELLERLSIVDGVAETLTATTAFVSGAVLVATCNRFEAYVDADIGSTSADSIHDIVLNRVIEVIGGDSDLDREAIRDSLAVRVGKAAAEHLFAVASGLESVVVGEGEVAGQVRRALESARRNGTTTPLLERLFQRASQTSRGVKNRTGIGSVGRSLVRLALDLAETRVSDWAQTRVLLVGTGRYAGACLAALRDRGVSDIRVYSPSGRAAHFAASHALGTADAGRLPFEVAAADIVVTCTIAAEPVLDASVLAAGRGVPNAPDPASAPRAGSVATTATTDPRQLIIDLGLPRNVNPDVATLPGVELLDLETIRLHAPLEELNASSQARQIVEHAANRFATGTEERSITPAVVALRKHVYDALDAEIERARARGDDGETEAALRHLAGVLLHGPMVRARELARAGDQAEFVAGLDAVFGINLNSTTNHLQSENQSEAS